MPWKATNALKERTKLVLEWERRWNETEGGRVNTWIERYRESNFDLLSVAERSRRPKTSPNAFSPETEDLIVKARKLYPRWGPRKLHAMLVERNPGIAVPSASAIAKVLKRRGFTSTRKRQRRAMTAGVSTELGRCRPDAASDLFGNVHRQLLWLRALRCLGEVAMHSCLDDRLRNLIEVRG